MRGSVRLAEEGQRPLGEETRPKAFVSKRTGVQKASPRSVAIARGRSVSAESSLPQHTQGNRSLNSKKVFNEPHEYKHSTSCPSGRPRFVPVRASAAELSPPSNLLLAEEQPMVPGQGGRKISEPLEELLAVVPTDHPLPQLIALQLPWPQEKRLNYLTVAS